MSLFDKLMAVDDTKVTEKKTATVKSDRLTELLGVETEITLKELPYRKVAQIVDRATKDNGAVDVDRAVDAECHLIRLSCDDIPFGDDDLQKKFRASDPRDLVEKMFGYEVKRLANIVADLSGYGEVLDEEEVKNG
jgi:hypothetical protein